MKVAEALLKTAGTTVKYTHLHVGDYLIDRTLLVERKTFSDFAASIKDGRLLGQASRLASTGLRVAIILEGTSADIPEMRIRREAVQGAIVAITVIFGIPLLRSRDAEESARLMRYSSRQLRAQTPRALSRIGKRPRGKLKIQLKILQGVPFIGLARAQILLECFGSVQEIFNSEEEQLAQVRGIGKKIACAIRECVGK